MKTWNYNEEQRKEIESLAEDYMAFISAGKTERRCAKMAIEQAEQAGYRNLADVIQNHETLSAGDKVYACQMNKSVVLVNIGTDPIESGMNILGAHIDSPRLDLKQHPLYEEDDLALLDTHYYGGIKKYQWVTIPLAIYGVVCKKDGSVVDIAIGDQEDDPVFVISDLLIHFGAEQMQRKATEVIEGENLNVTFGSMPLQGESEQAVKANILQILKTNYGIEEEDFISAELEAVPAGCARSCGLDRSMVLGYGHDDRICAYTSLRAFLETETVDRTAVCLLVDKEEVGSQGATGMQSKFFENVVAEVMNACGVYDELRLKRALIHSTMLSSDVCAAHDPNYPDISSPNNQPRFGGGIVLNKYTGARGKSGCNDANAEYIAKLRAVMEQGQVKWQTGELGKVDHGGGGTIAYILANYGMQVIDCGVPLHNMHAPHELASKADIYEARNGYAAFLKYMK
ncbi:aminopeptidase [Catenisphaera adipataccumulans]|uniref:M18 family aminopeptidase n=1 Tax=Catenisphaera adipataccumulans TaxID=700500 RepID=A0A7W8CVG2_9FIRM|nr:aminopeptidase [Catenisphaera adipataccumulans]MBB5182325.1 aspartyl aminopeptidase [Catenisphaera adipataccumulans]